MKRGLKIVGVAIRKKKQKFCKDLFRMAKEDCFN